MILVAEMNLFLNVSLSSPTLSQVYLGNFTRNDACADNFTSLVIDIITEGKNVEQVKKFRYLGVIVTEDGRCDVEIETRIGMAKDAFNKRRELLSQRMDRKLKKKIIKAVVWSVALYGSETWTMRKDEIDRLQAFEMWIWRRMEKINWRDKITNEQVLEIVKEKRTLIDVIRSRKKKWIGHVLRGNGLLKEIIEGRIVGKRPRGRKRAMMLDDMKEGKELYAEMKERARHRENWKAGIIK